MGVARAQHSSRRTRLAVAGCAVQAAPSVSAVAANRQLKTAQTDALHRRPNPLVCALTQGPQAPGGAVRARLERGLAQLELGEPALADALLAYLDLLATWNRKINLTSVRDPIEQVDRHLLDSLAVRPFIEGLRIADVGSGAGLPGIPLALTMPERHFLLVEAVGKKAAFLREAVRQLSLANVEVAGGRVEALDQPESFDAVVARAYGPLERIAAQAGHLLKSSGRLYALKGPAAGSEPVPEGFESIADHEIIVPGLDGTRWLRVLARSNDEPNGNDRGAARRLTRTTASRR